MKKLSLTLLSATALFSVTQAANAADSGPYIQASLYGTDLTDTTIKAKASGATIGTASYDSDIGLGAGAEIGYKFNKYLRGGVEAAYRHNGISSGGLEGEYNSTAALANLYIDVPTDTKLTPYIGAGAGYAFVSDTESDDGVFAYQGMAGVSMAASEKVDVILGYKYMGTSTPEFSSGPVSLEVPYKVHNVELGIRYKF